MKRKLLFLLTMLLAAVSGARAQSGTCGDNLTWTLNNGTLTISGTGEMPSYNSNEYPWYDYRSQITSVVVEEGVTSITTSAFSSCTNIQSLNAPSVTTMDYNALTGCTNLSTINIPNLTSFGRNNYRDVLKIN